MDRKPIEDITRADIIYCLKASSDYHSELCEKCKFYPNCDNMAQDDMTEVIIRNLKKLEKIEEIVNCELIAGRRNYKSCYNSFFEIVDVIQDRSRND